MTDTEAQLVRKGDGREAKLPVVFAQPKISPILRLYFEDGAAGRLIARPQGRFSFVD